MTGDKKSDITDLYETYGTQLLRGAVILVKDISLAEDVIQEVFMAMYLNYDKFRKEAKISTYLYRIMINKCREKLRKKWYTLRVDMKSLENIKVSSHDDQESNIVNSIDITEQICKLTRKYREVIVLYYYHGIPIKEISDILNISESNVKIRMKRGREKLKVYLKEESENDRERRKLQESN